MPGTRMPATSTACRQAADAARGANGHPASPPGGLSSARRPAQGYYAPHPAPGGTMPKAWFLVLCRDENDREACERTKALMHDCKVYDAEPTAAYHHVGERDFETVNDALRRMDELNELAGRDVIKISARIKYHG